MKKTLSLCVLIGLACSIARAQEPPKYEVLKKMYDDAIASLKQAQDAKNQLATQNEQLTKQLEAMTKERDELARRVNEFSERTYTIRAQQAAWNEFLKRYPALQARWKAFLETELLRPGNEAPTLIDPAWPFRVEG
jgi:peptidoglycan hydrolase CwlO-like protein